MSDAPPRLSVIVPAHRCAGTLRTVLAALRAARVPAGGLELVVVDDASGDDTADAARALADRVVVLDGAPGGPALARNRGAEVARGALLAFVDADVRVHPDALARLVAALDADAAVAAAFGAYDAAPPAPGLVSRYRNLLHHYVHVRAAGDTESFWAGLGVVRAAAFHEVGGFDARRYPRPQIEDIELGYRLRARGHRIRIVPGAQGAHLKRWTLAGGLRTDVRDRGVPWVRLILAGEDGGRASLNVSPAERVYTALTGVAGVALLVAVVARDVRWAFGAAAALGVVLAGNLPLLRWFARQRGLAFALGVVPLRVLYYALNGVSLAWGMLLHLRHDRRGAPRVDPLARPESLGRSST